MNASQALARLQRLGKPVVTTADATLALATSRPATVQMLRRLAAAGLLKRIRHGLWAVDVDVDPLALPEYLTAPLPAYVSFQSALSLHGMLSQIPAVIYVASLGHTRRIRTTVGAFSIHRLAPVFFGGYETIADSGIRLATPEKALLDVLYLGPARSRMFAHLPEMTIPASFDLRRARHWIARIPPGPRRRSVEHRLQLLLESDPAARRRHQTTSARSRGRARNRR